MGPPGCNGDKYDAQKYEITDASDKEFVGINISTDEPDSNGRGDSKCHTYYSLGSDE
jgi:hypothetical protein